MAVEYSGQNNERIQQALAELQALIEQAFPATIFEIFHGDDPDGMYLRATVDVEDIDPVMDIYIDRLVDMQVEERLPVYVIPAHTPERVARLVAEAEQRRAALAALERSQGVRPFADLA